MIIRTYLKQELEPYKWDGKFHGKYLIFSAAEIQAELARRADLEYKRYYESLYYPHLCHS